MTSKDRKIQLFLQTFYLLVGIYSIISVITLMKSDFIPPDIFDFYNQNIPAFHLAAGFVAGIASIVSFITLWLKVRWAYRFSIFTSGLLFVYNLEALGRAIYRNPYEAIPMIIILIVVLQSLPYLIRGSDRYI